MTTQELADRLLALCRAGQFEQAQRELYAPTAVSIESDMVPDDMRVVRGLEAILAKGQRFRQSVAQWHQVLVGDPIVAGRHVALRIYLDVSYADGSRATTDEVAVYTVEDGHIVQEEFFY